MLLYSCTPVPFRVLPCAVVVLPVCAIAAANPRHRHRHHDNRYGQTGTGKTHTMEGDIDCDEGAGMIPRAVQAIFAQAAVEQARPRWDAGS